MEYKWRGISDYQVGLLLLLLVVLLFFFFYEEKIVIYERELQWEELEEVENILLSGIMLNLERTHSNWRGGNWGLC